MMDEVYDFHDESTINFPLAGFMGRSRPLGFFNFVGSYL